MFRLVVLDRTLPAISDLCIFAPPLYEAAYLTALLFNDMNIY